MVAPPIRECPVVGFALVTFRTDVIRKALDLQTYDTFNSIEDLDACFSIRKMGYKVMCNWLSVAYHHAGATRWKDDSAMDILMENWERFKTKWGDGVPDA
jgi:GT2 family glycosyltransferase